MQNKPIQLTFFLFFCLIAARPLFAAENVLGLEDTNHYDIYISGYGGSVSVLKDVDIIAVKHLYDRNFLLIRTDTFNAKKSEGLIAFDSIQAILPTNRSSPLQNVQPYGAPSVGYIPK